LIVAKDFLLNRWRWAVGGAVCLVVGVPLAMPFLGLLGSVAGWTVWADADRISYLASNTLQLAAGALAVSLPAGIVAAILLFRTDLPGRRFFQFLTVLTLFVPLPLVASAWQATLGAGGWVAVGIWSDPSTWKPWALGLGPAAWVHAMNALPWVILIVGQGLRCVEPELEEDGLLAAGPWSVLTKITLVRAAGAIGAAALWVFVLVTTEITVTDTMQVRTFAEEVYTQLVVGDRNAVLRSVALAVPLVLLTWLFLVCTAFRLERDLPAADARLAPPLLFPLGRARWPMLALMLLGLAVLGGVPVASLIWKAGLSGTPPVWSGAVAWSHVLRVIRLRGSLVGYSLELAALTGLVVAGLGLLVCWVAAGARWLFVLILGLMAAAWTLPAPLVGFGLKDTILHLLDLSHSDILARVLYYGPSPAPVLWAHIIRFFPFGVALLWPLLRLIPIELFEAARVDGARPVQIFRWIIWPLGLPACGQVAVAVAVLSLGELGAGKLVETPGPRIFAHEIFEQMHYGVTNDLAALCLVLLGLVALGGVCWAVMVHWNKIPAESSGSGPWA
jgi:iron(III) transport system permease protein